MKNIVRKGISLIILGLSLMLQGKELNAQGQRQGSPVYKGFVASFGTRSMAVSSNIEELQGKHLIETGGQLGIVYGNDILRSKVNLFGYYSSAGSTPGTTILYTSSAALHFYPTQLLNKNSYRLQPYMTGGISYDRFRFFGYYINREPGVTNYSQAEAPYLGKLKQINAMAGAGLEIGLKDDFDFIHLFTEIKYVHNLSANTSHEAFAKTDLENKMHFVVGISFGAIQ